MTVFFLPQVLLLAVSVCSDALLLVVEPGCYLSAIHSLVHLSRKLSIVPAFRFCHSPFLIWRTGGDVAFLITKREKCHRHESMQKASDDDR